MGLRPEAPAELHRPREAAVAAERGVLEACDQVLGQHLWVLEHVFDTARRGATTTALDRYVAQPDAAFSWKKAAELADPAMRERLLAVFSGHGIARGNDVALLLSDFGEDDSDPLEGAIDFSRMAKFRIPEEMTNATRWYAAMMARPAALAGTVANQARVL